MKDFSFLIFSAEYDFEHFEEIIYHKSTEPQHYVISREDFLKYFTFIQRLFGVDNLETAAEIFITMSQREQERFYTLMKDFIDPTSKLARERVVLWANQYVGTALKIFLN